ncbi:MAG: hypothetical protein ABSG43_24315 [Solirubrobacteraceae bacterium]
MQRALIDSVWHLIGTRYPGATWGAGSLLSGAGGGGESAGDGGDARAAVGGCPVTVCRDAAGVESSEGGAVGAVGVDIAGGRVGCIVGRAGIVAAGAAATGVLVGWARAAGRVVSGSVCGRCARWPGRVGGVAVAGVLLVSTLAG